MDTRDSIANHDAVVALDPSRHKYLGVHSEVRPGISTNAAQHAWIIRQIGLRKIHHNASLRKIPHPEPDFIANADCLAQPQALDLSLARSVDQNVGPEAPFIYLDIRD